MASPPPKTAAVAIETAIPSSPSPPTESRVNSTSRSTITDAVITDTEVVAQDEQRYELIAWPVIGKNAKRVLQAIHGYELITKGELADARRRALFARVNPRVRIRIATEHTSKETMGKTRLGTDTSDTIPMEEDRTVSFWTSVMTILQHTGLLTMNAVRCGDIDNIQEINVINKNNDKKDHTNEKDITTVDQTASGNSNIENNNDIKLLHEQVKKKNSRGSSHDNVLDGEFFIASSSELASVIRFSCELAPGRPLALIDVFPILEKRGILKPLTALLWEAHDTLGLDTVMARQMGWTKLNIPKRWDYATPRMSMFFSQSLIQGGSRVLDSALLRSLTRYVTLSYKGFAAVLNVLFGPSPQDYYDEDFPSITGNDESNNSQIDRSNDGTRLAESDSIWTDEEFVFIVKLDDVVIGASTKLLESVLYPCDAVLTLSDFRSRIRRNIQIYGENMRKKEHSLDKIQFYRALSQIDMELIELRIFMLKLARLAVDPTDSSNILVKLATNNSGSNKEVNSGNEIPVLLSDFQFSKICNVREKVQSLINKFSERIAIERNEAMKILRVATKENNSDMKLAREHASVHVERVQRLRQELTKQTKILSTLDGLISKIQEASSVLESNEALQAGSIALKTILMEFKNPDGSKVESPEDAIDAVLQTHEIVQETIEAADAVSNAVNFKEEVANVEDDAELLAELEQLTISEKRRTVEQHSSPEEELSESQPEVIPGRISHVEEDKVITTDVEKALKLAPRVPQHIHNEGDNPQQASSGADSDSEKDQVMMDVDI